MASGGRLCFVCWAGLEANPHWQIPFGIVTARLGMPAARPPQAPGPMAFKDAAYVQAILAAAGFSDILVTPNMVKIMGESLDEEARIACLIGPAGALLDEKKANAQMRDVIRDEIIKAIKPFDTGTDIRMPATIYVVSARA